MLQSVEMKEKLHDNDDLLLAVESAENLSSRHW
jgi:hypothetical protein